MKAVFITATDTEVGKTVVTGLLASYLLDKGCNAITQKWIQTGSSGFPPDIAEHLKLMGRHICDIKEYLPDIVPYNFTMPASPHLAAESQDQKIDAAKIKNSFITLSKTFDTVIVEGIGGVLVPFSRKDLLIDIAKELDLPVIIVAKNKLGAINHTLLTIEAIKIRRMKILGVIFNNSAEKEDKAILADNPKIIKALTGQSILGTLLWTKQMDTLHRAFKPIGDKILVSSQKL